MVSFKLAQISSLVLLSCTIMSMQAGSVPGESTTHNSTRPTSPVKSFRGEIQPTGEKIAAKSAGGIAKRTEDHVRNALWKQGDASRTGIINRSLVTPYIHGEHPTESTKKPDEEAKAKKERRQEGDGGAVPAMKKRAENPIRNSVWKRADPPTTPPTTVTDVKKDPTAPAAVLPKAVTGSTKPEDESETKKTRKPKLIAKLKGIMGKVSGGESS